MIRANCRDCFTAEDFNFIVSALSRSPSDAVSLTSLLADAETRDQILDHDVLHKTILESAATLSISPNLYFYVVTRHALKSAGITSRELTDYIASLLAAFSRGARLSTGESGGLGETAYVSDLLLALQNAAPRQRFLIRSHIGNFTLFLTGIFHERIERRARRGAPDCEFYERMGIASFRAVSRERLARQCQLDGIYDGLADRFHDVRIALNRLSGEILFLEEPPPRNLLA